MLFNIRVCNAGWHPIRTSAGYSDFDPPGAPQADAAFGLHFVKIKNQDAAANLKISSFRFFLDDFSHLSIQCVL